MKKEKLTCQSRNSSIKRELWFETPYINYIRVFFQYKSETTRHGDSLCHLFILRSRRYAGSASSGVSILDLNATLLSPQTANEVRSLKIPCSRFPARRARVRAAKLMTRYLFRDPRMPGLWWLWEIVSGSNKSFAIDSTYRNCWTGRLDKLRESADRGYSIWHLFSGAYSGAAHLSSRLTRFHYCLRSKDKIVHPSSKISIHFA